MPTLLVSHASKNSPNKIFRRQLGWLKTHNLVCAALACGASLAAAPYAYAQSLPANGTVSAGSASITTGTNSVTVSQTSDRAVINWDSFSIANGNSVQFQQPGSQSATLNRVTGNTSSAIAGSISANGSVYIVNPNGIAITSTGNVQTGGGFVASTLDISDEDFVAGRERFRGNGASAAVRNAGRISAGSGAYVALLGGAVSNSGSIVVPLGRLAMGSGEQIALDLNGGNFLQVAVPTSLVTGDQALIDNSGTITVAGGVVHLRAAVVKDAVRNVINMSGSISADSAVGDGGRIYLIGGSDTQNLSGNVTVSGSLSARATGAQGNGGFVETSGASIDLQSANVSTLAANGNAGLWLIDPVDFTIAAAGGDITGAQLSANLANGNVRILSNQGASGTGGDIFVNDAVSWSANTLTLDAFRDINVNAIMRATGTAGFVGIVGDTAQNGTGSASGNLNFGLNSSGFFGRLDLASTTSFNLNGEAYTIITSLGAQGSTTGTDLQGIVGGSRVSGLLVGRFVLGTDIDASATAGWNNGAGFVPIGNFAGQFNGLGHVISDLNVRTSSTIAGGLFASITDNVGGFFANTPSVSNVGISSGSITSAGLNTDAGGLVGFNNGIIRNVFSRANVNVIAGASGDAGGLVGDLGVNGVIINAFATGNVTSASSNAGGLVGLARGRITRAYATGTVTGTGTGSRDIGGLVGNADGGAFVFENVFATGNVSGSEGVGGLIGEADGGTITDAYATGTATALDSLLPSAGGLIGNAFGTTITRAYATGRVSAPNFVPTLQPAPSIGGLVGFNGFSFNVNDITQFIDAYWDAQSTGQQAACGGTACRGTFSSLTTAQTLQAASFQGFNVATIGGTGATWRIYEGQTTPLLTAFLTPAIVSVSSDPVTVTFNGQDQSGVIGGGARLAIGGAVADPSRIFGSLANTCVGGAGACVNVGTYTVNASAGAGLFSNQFGFDLIAGSGGTGTLIITPAPVTVTFNANLASSVYGDAISALSGTVSALGFFGSDTLANSLLGTAVFSTAATPTTGVGTFAITGSGLTGNNSNYNFSFLQAPGNSSAYTITPRSIDVTANAASSVYGAALPLFTFNVGGAGLVNGDTLSGSLVSSGTPLSNVGSYAITQGTLGNPNYTINFTGAEHTITPAALTIAGLSQNRLYSGLAQTNGFTVSGLVGSDQVTAVDGLASGTNVGSFSDNLSNATGTGLSNYNISFVNGGLNITPAPLTITGNSSSSIFNGLNQVNGFTASGLLGSDTVTGVSGLGSRTNAGFTADALSNATGTGLSNYNITFVNGGLTVTPAPVTVTFNANLASSIYGNAISALSGTVDVIGLLGGDTLANSTQGTAVFNTVATPASGVGSFAITGSGLVGNNGNYAFSFLQAPGNGTAYTITPRPIDVTANAASFVYGSAVPALTFAVGGLGLVNGDSLAGALVTSATSLSNVGTFAINRGTLANPNYVINYTGANITITPAPLTITGNTASVNFNGRVQTNGFTTSGLVGSDSVTNVTGLATGTEVGTFADALSAATGIGLTNYTITFVNGSLTITALPAETGLVPFLPIILENSDGPQLEASGEPGISNNICPPDAVAKKLREDGKASLVCSL